MGAMLELARKERRHTLGFGAGRSYGDSCLAASDHVISLRPLDRFISADWETGVIRAEAGVSLAQLLAQSVPRAWFLPVAPGTSFVTLGGALANDVHGKNHVHRGSFGSHVRRIGLYRSDRGYLECGPDLLPEFFSATVGGLGLSGLIAWIEIQLLPISSGELDIQTERFSHLDAFFDIAEEWETRFEYSVAWVDCLASGRQLGRGILKSANFALQGRVAAELKNRLNFSFTPPVSLANRMSVLALNGLYWHSSSSKPVSFRSGFQSFFFPLDAIGGWNRAYGPRGFQQFQAVIPKAVAKLGITALLAEIAAYGHGSYLAVLKRFGSAGSPGWLSFPCEGTTLALDFPQSENLVKELLPRLDAVVRDYGGRLYPAKDAHMSGEDFRRAYPDWERVEALRDPALLSRFWNRVRG